MIKATLPKRYDDWGSGDFSAPRGNREHKGIDYECPVGASIHAGISGRVSKLGFAYGDDLSYRYVQITDDMNRDWRYFYVEPLVQRGRFVSVGQVIGTCQDIQARYTNPRKKMKNHVHLEILKHGKPINPEDA